MAAVLPAEKMIQEVAENGRCLLTGHMREEVSLESN